MQKWATVDAILVYELAVLQHEPHGEYTLWFR